jgi:hypothetical protein
MPIDEAASSVRPKLRRGVRFALIGLVTGFLGLASQHIECRSNPIRPPAQRQKRSRMSSLTPSRRRPTSFVAHNLLPNNLRLKRGLFRRNLVWRRPFSASSVLPLVVSRGSSASIDAGLGRPFASVSRRSPGHTSLSRSLSRLPLPLGSGFSATQANPPLLRIARHPTRVDAEGPRSQSCDALVSQA